MKQGIITVTMETGDKIKAKCAKQAAILLEIALIEDKTGTFSLSANDQIIILRIEQISHFTYTDKPEVSLKDA